METEHLKEDVLSLNDWGPCMLCMNPFSLNHSSLISVSFYLALMFSWNTVVLSRLPLRTRSHVPHQLIIFESICQVYPYLPILWYTIGLSLWDVCFSSITSTPSICLHLVSAISPFNQPCVLLSPFLTDGNWPPASRTLLHAATRASVPISTYEYGMVWA